MGSLLHTDIVQSFNFLRTSSPKIGTDLSQSADVLLPPPTERDTFRPIRQNSQYQGNAPPQLILHTRLFIFCFNLGLGDAAQVPRKQTWLTATPYGVPGLALGRTRYLRVPRFPPCPVLRRSVSSTSVYSVLDTPYHSLALILGFLCGQQANDTGLYS